MQMNEAAETIPVLALQGSYGPLWRMQIHALFACTCLKQTQPEKTFKRQAKKSPLVGGVRCSLGCFKAENQIRIGPGYFV